MKTGVIGVEAFALLGFAVAGCGQEGAPRTIAPLAVGEGMPGTDGVPRTWREIARERLELAEAFRYKGTTAVPDRELKDDANVWAACAVLARADLVPESRLRRFAGLNPEWIVVGWHLRVEGLEMRGRERLVRVRAVPLVRAPGEGTIGMSSFHREFYRIVGGEVRFVGSDPTVTNESIGMGGAS